MKISDFIKELSTYNQNADITLTTSETITLSYICKDSYGKELAAWLEESWFNGEDVLEVNYKK